MRASHFSVGVTKDHQMYPAPYKVSDPSGAVRAKAKDSNELRKESWILGQCPETFTSVQTRSFTQPRVIEGEKAKDNQIARDLRKKVSGTSYKNESPANNPDVRFQTNTQIVHKNLGEL